MGNLIRILFTLLIVLGFTGVEAKVRLPRLISDGMILQRDTEVKIWGWAASGETVNLKFLSQNYKTKADKKGNWSIIIPAQKAGGPYTMEVNDIQINDVLFGDVWLCSGQSNMELPIRRVLDLYQEEVQSVNNPNIRHFRVPIRYDFVEAKDDLDGGTWQMTNPESILEFSAVAYFFAKELYDKYNVPIGLINSSVGGSPAEAWISMDAVKKYPVHEAEAKKYAAKGYIDNVRKEEQAKNNAWYAEMMRLDKGLGIWDKEQVNTADWGDYYLPGLWRDKAMNIRNGVVWLRRSFEISEEDSGKPATLRLGYIIDSDSAFINGKFVGTTGYQYPPRIYQIPEGILKAGKNFVTVRVVTNPNGGFQEDKPYKIILDNKTIDLTGVWKYNTGAELPSAPSTTFFQYKPTGLFNSMIAPINNYKLKGVIWYQGESNLGRAKEYKSLMQDLINGWREKFNEPMLPFIYAQLPELNKAWNQPSESGLAELREAQREILNLPATGMAVTLGLGEWNDIHPLNKKGVAGLLALEARRVAYKENDITTSGPKLIRAMVKDNSIILSFNSVGSGLYSNQILNGFTIAGADGKYVWANASVISENRVRVWSHLVQQPVSVRYAWADNPQGANLKNKEGLFASPFMVTESDLTSPDIISENEVGVHDDFNYELWKDHGDVSMILKEGGAFECKWTDINNVLFRTGKKFDMTKTHRELGPISVDYDCDYQPNGNSYLCVYGWSVDPLVEFYVVESWGSWRPPGAEPIGTVEVDGGTYEIYKTMRINQPSIIGDTTFPQYWSVRIDRKTQGNISLSDHFEAWEKLDLGLGKIFEIAFCVEGFRSSGAANLKSHVLTIGDTTIGSDRKK